MVKTDLNSTVAGADASKVILLDSGVYHVLTAGYFFKNVRLSLGREITDNEIDNLGSGFFGGLIVLKTRIASHEVVARKHGLLDCFRCVTIDLHHIDCFRCR